MVDQSLKAKFEIKELELNALLEITQAINSNLSEESLYKIYNFTLRSNLNIKKLALFVLDAEWNCKVHFGTTHHYGKVKLLPEFKTIQDIKFPSKWITELYIPIYPKAALNKPVNYRPKDSTASIQTPSNIQATEIPSN